MTLEPLRPWAVTRLVLAAGVNAAAVGDNWFCPAILPPFLGFVSQELQVQHCSEDDTHMEKGEPKPYMLAREELWAGRAPDIMYGDDVSKPAETGVAGCAPRRGVPLRGSSKPFGRAIEMMLLSPISR